MGEGHAEGGGEGGSAAALRPRVTMPHPSHPSRPRIVVVVGATASGKTALSLTLAERLNGEIVNADSRQIYRGMDIGTAKPTRAERATIPHQLIDIRDPDQLFSLAEFLDLAGQAISDILGRARVPIVVGGTGQYVRALVEGWTAPVVPPDATLRAELLARAERDGGDVLHTELAARDPLAASRIDARNIRRVVRALEVIRLTGRPFSEQGGVSEPAYAMLMLGLAWPRDGLYRRIDARVEAMFSDGMVDEVRGLVHRGYDCILPAMGSIGYAQVCQFLAGDLTLSEAVDRTKTGTHRLARTQAAWFRRDDPRIHWLNPAAGDVTDEAEKLSRGFLARAPADHPSTTE